MHFFLSRQRFRRVSVVTLRRNSETQKFGHRDIGEEAMKG